MDRFKFSSYQIEFLYKLECVTKGIKEEENKEKKIK
jgi:hypothetical protein